MEKRQHRTLVAFQNVLIFLDQHPITPEPPLLTGMKKSLRASIRRINQLGSTQRTALMLDGGHIENRRRVMRRQRLMPLVRIAKPLVRFAPGAERALTVPHARADALTVAEAALAIARTLKPHQKLLTTAGYPSTFLKELQHEARELALATKQTAAARQTRAKATADLAREFRKAMQTVTVIEGLVMLHGPKDKASLEYWKNRRRVGARIGRPPQRKARRGDHPMPPDSSAPSPPAP